MKTSWEIRQGDVLERLRQMPSDSVHCVVTSPPYWGLRDYGAEGQIGLEPTPQEFIAKMTEVFREVRRVLRPDGTCWMNMGDGYNSGSSGGLGGSTLGGGQANQAASNRHGKGFVGGLKPKDLIVMPWRLALALQDDGWWLRQDIIWAKPNPMPESVTDRCTKAHEYIFLFTKSAKYFYDAEAIKEPVSGNAHARGNGVNPKAAGANSRFNVSRDHAHITRPKQNSSYSAAINELVGKRNKRSVWEIATESFSEAHFATFPTKLVEPCILAGTSEKGVCDNCWTPWDRETEKTVAFASGSGRAGNVPEGKHAGGAQEQSGDYDIRMGPVTTTKTIGWKRGCSCETNTAIPSTVMDPFNGSGTTGLVALANGCNYIGIELNPEYVAMAERRLEAATAQETLLFA